MDFATEISLDSKTTSCVGQLIATRDNSEHFFRRDGGSHGVPDCVLDSTERVNEHHHRVISSHPDAGLHSAVQPQTTWGL